MNVNSLNYNHGSPSELIHKFQKDAEVTRVVEGVLRDTLGWVGELGGASSGILAKMVYFACCHVNGFKTLGEEYAYLTHAHPTQQLFIWRKTRLLLFVLRTFLPSVLAKWTN